MTNESSNRTKFDKINSFPLVDASNGDSYDEETGQIAQLVEQ